MSRRRAGNSGFRHTADRTRKVNVSSRIYRGGYRF